MNRLWILAAMCGASFVMFMGSMAVTASPSFAQAVKPPQDVRVVNGASLSIPVSVQGTPTVNVGNDISITSLPAVQIGNDGSAPVPVTVENLPASPNGREPVNITVSMSLYDDQFNTSALAYTVPDGKRLTIETMSGIAFSALGTDAKHRFTLSVGQDVEAPKYYLQMEDALDDPLMQTQTGTKQVGIHASAGTPIYFFIFRNKALGSTGGNPFGMTLTASGYLEDVPAAP